MAKVCEVAERRRSSAGSVSHAHNVSPRRFEPNLQTVRAMVNGGDQAHPRLHAVPALEQGHQGRVRQAAVSSPGAPEGDRSVFAGRPRGALAVRLRPGADRSGDGRAGRRRHRRADAARARQHRRAARRPAGLAFAHVVRTTVFLADMNDFAAMNEVYATFFAEPYPGALDRPGRAPAAGRARRNRRHRSVSRAGNRCRARGLTRPPCALDVEHPVHRLAAT